MSLIAPLPFALHAILFLLVGMDLLGIENATEVDCGCWVASAGNRPVKLL
jgi:hypothetical protein